MHLVDLSLVVMLSFRSLNFMQYWSSYDVYKFDWWNFMCLNLLIHVELDEISYGMMMYVRRRFQWYAFGDFLCMSVLEDEEHEEHDECARVLVPESCLIFPRAVCMCFGVIAHVLVQVSASDWPAFQLNETRRLTWRHFQISTWFDSGTRHFPFGFLHFLHLCYSCSYASFIHF